MSTSQQHTSISFTFGIITNGGQLDPILNSIHANQIPTYEIIIVGNGSFTPHPLVRQIDFDENVKPMWITKKKNIICQEAKYENIVLCHDYIYFFPNWYQGWCKFGNDFDWAVNQILNIDGSRYRDYITFPYYQWWNKIGGHPGKFLLPYNVKNNKKLNKFLYVSGTYYVIKKELALKFPLNEELIWEQGEDVELSVRLMNEDKLVSCNPYSGVMFMKPKVKAFCSGPQDEFTQEEFNIMMEKINQIDESFFDQQLKH